MSGFVAITYEKHDGVAYIVLNRPEVLNRYNIQMRDELYQVLTAIRDDAEVLAVVFKGAGERAFCVGADLTEFGTAPSPIIARQVRWERDVWGLLNDMKQPLIAAVHGYVLGSGMELALFCDIRIASDDAVFGLPEVSLGMIPAAGGTQMLPRVIGRGRALYLLLTGDRIGAREAFRMGLVNRVVKRGELYSTADEVAQMIVSNNPIAVQYAKEAIRWGCDLKLKDGLSLEGKLAKIVNTSSANIANCVALGN
jgi:enoyl-CoA hydratase/carnithine racemase